MSRRAVNVEEALARAYKAAKVFVDTPSPNEPITEIDVESIKKRLASIEEVLGGCSNDDLIGASNAILSDLGFPEVEHQVASRGLLVTKLQGMELVACLQQVKNNARAAGYRDPETANLDIASEASQEFMSEVNAALQEVRDLTSSLDRQLRQNKQTGLSISLGLFSIDIGTLLGVLQNSTKDAQDYIFAKSRVSASVLKAKLEIVNNNSQTLIGAIKSEAKKFGRKIIELGSRIAKAAAESYLNGLTLIKSSFNRPVASAMGAVPHTKAQDSIEASDDLSYVVGDDFDRVRALLIEKLSFLKSVRRAPSMYFEQGSLTGCSFIISHGQYHVAFYIKSRDAVAEKDNGRVKPISLTESLSKEEYVILRSVDKMALVQAAKEAYNSI